MTAVSLDAAGTLIGIRRPVGDTYAEIAGRHGIAVDARAITAAFRTVFPRMSPLAFGAGDRDRLERQERDWWRTLVRGCLGPQGQHRAFNGFFDELYWSYASAAAWQVYPEVPGVLDALDDIGVPVVVVSNFDSRLHRILDELDLATRFRAVLCSSQAGAAKPDRRIFELACRTLATPAGSTLHAGDDRRADLEGARSAGLTAILIRRGEPIAPAATDTVTDLRGLLEHLQR